MNPVKPDFSKILIAAFLISMIISCTNQTGDNTDPTIYVDPNIGGVAPILVPTRPTVQLPNQMIRMYPNRKDYLDDQITSFPLSMISHRGGQLFQMMPFTGETTNPVSLWGKQNETAAPYYYSVWLQDYNTTLEFVPGEKAALYRLTFPEDEVPEINFTIANSEGSLQLESENVIIGVESFRGMHAWVYGEFDVPVKSGQQLNDNKQLILSFEKGQKQPVQFKYAISYISQEQAKKNLENEIRAWDFDKMKQNAHKIWAETLGQIEVEGDNEARKRTFYSALYRCYERMVDITEDGKYYSNYDGKVHEDPQDFYIDDWIWDTYLAHHPLRALLDPDKENDMMSSYVRMYEQSGWLPQFCLLWGENPCMNGFHSTITFLDDYRKNVLKFDMEKAYEGMKKNALEGTMLPWRNGAACSLDTFYHEHGYYPALHPGEAETVPEVHPFESRQAVAVTLGQSYDDWALAELAKELGKKEDYEHFIKTSKNYKNLYWKDKGFFMPKDAEGKWIDIDPKWAGGMGGRAYYDENNGWTYLWQVQQDVKGFMNLMGGEKIFEQRLDQLFREDLGRSKYANWAKFPDFTGIVGQFSMGNEPSFHIPYLYNFTDSPWKTQKRIRMLLDTWYPDNIFGIPGDEDGGGMTAFVVFSCMGIYPVVPGIPLYTIGSPVFKKVTINLDSGKKFSIVADNYDENNIYIQKAWINGKPLNGPWISHEDVVNGGELKLQMGRRPNKTWGNSDMFYELAKPYLN